MQNITYRFLDEHMNKDDKLFFKTQDKDEHFRFSNDDWIELRAIFAAALVKNKLAK